MFKKKKKEDEEHDILEEQEQETEETESIIYPIHHYLNNHYLNNINKKYAIKCTSTPYKIYSYKGYNESSGVKNMNV
jgi:hypothetical protein